MPRQLLRSAPRSAAGLLAFLLLIPRPAEPGDRPGIGYGLAMGYGYGVSPRENQRGEDVQDVRTLAIEPYLHLPLRTFGDGSRWYHGRLDGLLQASILVELEPRSGTAASVHREFRKGRIVGSHGEWRYSVEVSLRG